MRRPSVATILRAGARGLALFFGAFSLANSAAMLRPARNTGDIWWIDLSAVPPALAVAFGLTAAVLLVAWGLRPAAAVWRKWSTASVAALLALAALANGVAFYSVWATGTVVPSVPVPSSALYALGFVWIALAAAGWRIPDRHLEHQGGAEATATVVAVLLLVGLFPMVNAVFFGMTDYRRPADVAVVLGAKAYANGALSTSLEDRVRTGADLYKSGLVRYLVMSGGVGESGVDEPTAMRARAVALGVPASAVLMDPAGDNTDATVRETTAIFAEHGFRRVLAVSQFYHLPRIKLAYRQAGWDVQTVPATFSRYIPETPYLVLREVPAFWVYWSRSVAGL